MTIMNSISETKIMTEIPEVDVTLIPYADVPQVSARDKAYAKNDAALRPFYKYEVKLEEFARVIQDKQNESIDRAILVEALKEQYSRLSSLSTDFQVSQNVKKNIDALGQNNTFTIITAHQPTLFTGPLYYVYKIISTINLTRQLNSYLPDYQFVPVFITGGEDHDFEEMNHVNIFNKKLVWENEESGSVGMMKTASLRNVLNELKEILGDSEKAQAAFQLIEKPHTEFETYSDAAVALANELFGEDGLVVINMNNAQLKKRFVPIIKKEILESFSFPLVNETIEKLNVAGFKTQASPREINFFYLINQIRERIVFEPARPNGENEKYQVLNTDISFSKKEMEKEIENHPERFSPNVVMRPIYQEYIIPNLAYIGGGGELAYWMERQNQFEQFGINFPMLIRRNSVVWIDKGTKKKMGKLNLNATQLFTESDALIKLFVKDNSENELNFTEEKNTLQSLFKTIEERTKVIDPTLVKTVAAEGAKQLKSLESLEARLLKAEKSKHDVSIKQIGGLKDKLFPSNGLQERKDNFIPFYLKHGKGYFEVLKSILDPLEKSFVVIEEK